MDRARGAFAAGLCTGSAWGAPVFDAELVRNRHGPIGRWIMEWKCDECLFSEPTAYPQPVAAAPAHRPLLPAGSGRQHSVRTAWMNFRASSPPKITTRCSSTRSTKRRHVPGSRSACRLRLRARSARAEVYRRRRGRRRQDAERHRRLVRPLHAAGGAGCAAWAVSRYHRLRASVRRRGGADGQLSAMRCRGRVYRQRRDRRHRGRARTLTRHAHRTIVADGGEAAGGRARCRSQRSAPTRRSCAGSIAQD